MGNRTKSLFKSFLFNIVIVSPLRVIKIDSTDFTIHVHAMCTVQHKAKVYQNMQNRLREIH
jgi:hypothetical protein